MGMKKTAAVEATFENPGKLAEGMEFEPTVPIGYNGFRDRLSRLS